MLCEYHKGYRFGMSSMVLGVFLLGLLNYLWWQDFMPGMVVPVVFMGVVMEMLFYFKINFFGCQYCGEADETL